MADKGDWRLCVDRVIPLHRKITAAEAALAENPKNRAKHLELRPGASAHPAKIALFTGKMWKPGRKLTVRFLDGSAVQKQKTKKYAAVWCDYADIGLAFDEDSSAEIRISFKADTGSWSAVGTDCLSRGDFPLNEPTMNFGWLRDDTEDEEYRRVVLHEFGHALGAIHEHQNPVGKTIQWNLPAVYDYFSGPPNNWTKQEIDHNVVQKYSVNQLNGTKFDKKSIMLYSFPAELMVGGNGTPNNINLSAGDKSFIGKAYPKRA